MRKFAKISLAAAVAVAGMTSVASAKPLEEAIKGVDATGYVTYRMDHQNFSEGTESKETHNYKAGLTLTVPATDDIKLKLQGVVWGQGLDGKESNKGNPNDPVVNETNPSTDLMEANFVYTGVENLTAIVGKQAINTPWTEGTSHINKTNSGTGALALYNAGFATFAAAHFTAHNVSADNNDVNDTDVLGGGQNITVAAAIIPIMDVATAQIWYADIAKDSNAKLLKKGADALTVSADINLMDLAKLNVAHSTLDGNDDAILKKQKLTKAVLSGSVDIVNLAAGYAKGGKDGALVAFDSDASAAFKGWRVHTNTNTLKDIKAYMLKADVNVMDNLNLALTHVSAKADVDNTGKNQETFAQATYKFASNLSAYLRYGTQKDELVDGDKDDAVKSKNTRLEVAFKF